MSNVLYNLYHVSERPPNPQPTQQRTGATILYCSSLPLPPCVCACGPVCRPLLASVGTWPGCNPTDHRAPSDVRAKQTLQSQLPSSTNAQVPNASAQVPGCTHAKRPTKRPPPSAVIVPSAVLRSAESANMHAMHFSRPPQNPPFTKPRGHRTWPPNRVDRASQSRADGSSQVSATREPTKWQKHVLAMTRPAQPCSRSPFTSAGEARWNICGQAVRIHCTWMCRRVTLSRLRRSARRTRTSWPKRAGNVATPGRHRPRPGFASAAAPRRHG